MIEPMGPAHLVRNTAVLVCCVMNMAAAAEALGEGPLMRWSLVYAYDDQKIFTIALQDDETGRMIRILNGFEFNVESAGVRYGSRGGKPFERTISGKAFSSRIAGKYTRTFSVEKISANEISAAVSVSAEAPLRYSDYFYLNSQLIAGRGFTFDNGERFIIEKAPHAAINDRFKVGTPGETPRFNTITFHTEIGAITFSFSRKKSIVDFRKIHWSPARSHIFCTFPDVLVDAGTMWEETMTIRVAPDAAGIKAYKESASGWFLPKKEAADRTRIIAPAPKSALWGNERFSMKGGISCRHNARDRRITDYLNEKLSPFGVTPVCREMGDASPEYLFLLGDNADAKEAVAQYKKTLDAVANDEKYLLAVTPSGIVIVAASEKGLWCAIQTLLQTAQHQWDGEIGLSLKSLTVADWPDYPERRFMLRINNLADFAFLRQYVDNALLWKYNSVLIEFQYGMDIKNIPELKNDRDLRRDGSSTTVSEQDLMSIIKFIRSRPVTITPLWNCGKLLEGVSMKHAKVYPRLMSIALHDAVFKKGDVVANYDISLDETFMFNREVCDYFLQLCGAKKICIGLDEIYDFSQYTKNSKDRGDESFASYVNKFTDYYSGKGITVSMYHDMLCSRSALSNADYFPANAVGGSEKAISSLRNKEHLEIEYWDYTEKSKFPAIDYFQKQGFRVNTLAWFREDNIKGLARDGYERGVRSVTASIWCFIMKSPGRMWQLIGNFTDPQNFPTYTFLPAVHYSAEQFWNATADRYDYNAWKETILLYDRRNGFCPPIEKQFRIPIDVQMNTFFPTGENEIGTGGAKMPGIRSVPNGEQTMSGIRFLIPAKGDLTGCVSVKGRVTPDLPDSVVIPMGVKDHQKLIFLHTGIHSRTIPPDSSMGVSYLLHYEDGSVQSIPLQLDKNIMFYSPPTKRHDSQDTNLWCAWTGDAGKGEFPAAIYAFEWDNPNPEKTITSLRVQSVAGSGSVLLFAVTGIKR